MDNTLILDSIIKKNLGISTTTLWRWEQDPEIGFPKAIYIRGRKFRDSVAFEEWRKRMSAKAGVKDSTTTKKQQSREEARRKLAVKVARKCKAAA